MVVSAIKGYGSPPEPQVCYFMPTILVYFPPKKLMTTLYYPLFGHLGLHIKSTQPALLPIVSIKRRLAPV